jgi:hypothetical protein
VFVIVDFPLLKLKTVSSLMAEAGCHQTAELLNFLRLRLVLRAHWRPAPDLFLGCLVHELLDRGRRTCLGGYPGRLTDTTCSQALGS